MALKGLTAQDRKDWEKRFAAQLEGRTPEEIDNAYVRYNFKHKYQGNDDFASLSTMSVPDMEAYWNNDFDTTKQEALSRPLPSIDTLSSVDSLRTDATR